MSQNDARALFLHGKAVGVLRKYGKWPYPTYETCWFFSLGTTTTATTKDKGDIQQSKRRGRVNCKDEVYGKDKEDTTMKRRTRKIMKTRDIAKTKNWAFGGDGGTCECGGECPPTPLCWWRHGLSGDVMGPSVSEKFFGKWAGKYFWRVTVKV